jgi:polyisoprenoid-binding protein YceI
MSATEIQPGGKTLMTKRYEIDKNHTNLGFTAKHMMFTTVRGRFNDFDGHLEIEDGDYSTARGSFDVKVASLESGNDKRDEHLRSADFFDAATHATLSFRPTAVRALGSDRYAVTGDLTIREVTKPVELQVSVEGRIPRDAFGKERIAISASGVLNRKDWGLNWNMAMETGGFLVSDEIKLEIESAFIADAVEPSATAAA